MFVPKRIWTDDKIERLRGLVKQKLKYSEIGRIMGVSKNSIVGACHRYVDTQPVIPRTAPKRIKSKRGGKRVFKLPKFNSEKYKERVYKNKTAKFPTAGCCKWIIGEPRNLRCCGFPRPLVKPFCDVHAAIVYIAPTPPKVNYFFRG